MVVLTVLVKMAVYFIITAEYLLLFQLKLLPFKVTRGGQKNPFVLSVFADLQLARIGS